MPSPSAPYFLVRGLRSALAGPFDLTVARGECVAVMGASGSGKSVFLRLVADMDPGSGEAFLQDRERGSWTAPQWRRQVIYQAAEPAWWAATAQDHVLPADLPAAQALMPALGLQPDLLTQPIDRLSTGERQRMALLRSLARRPAVLLLDEPTASLDAASTLAVEALLRTQLEAGLSIVLVTHSQEQAARMASRQFEMRDRRLHPAAADDSSALAA